MPGLIACLLIVVLIIFYIMGIDEENRIRQEREEERETNPMSDIKEHVGKGKMVRFLHYQDGVLWYRCVDSGFEFPVPCEDFGNGIALPEDKSISYMRWIRKHLELIQKAKEEQGVK